MAIPARNLINNNEPMIEINYLLEILKYRKNRKQYNKTFVLFIDCCNFKKEKYHYVPAKSRIRKNS